MRIKEIDIARGFTVFIMPGVHALMLYGNNAARTSWLGMIFGFLAEGPGAPLFMFLMGTSFYFSKRKNLLPVLKRAAGLLTVAYLLNFLKFALLQLFHVLPGDFIKDYGISKGNKGVWELLLTGDILQFATIALVVLGLINKIKWRYAISLSLIFIIVIISPITTGFEANYLLDLFTAEHGLVFFPVFPWLVYPLAGFCSIYLLKKKNGFWVCFYCGIMLLGISFFLSQLYDIPLTENFYRSRPVATTYHLGVVLMWLWLCHIAIKIIEPGMICKLFYWLSKNILSIYIIQWPIVCWLLPVAGYRVNDIIQTAIWMMFVSFLSFMIMYLYEWLIKKELKYAQR
ncbi:MAG TPA: heparan-alpha-glucosaminide N-acetyltransferase domain-containing protein [Parafilimonas sp.]|nr:heparan-alpha-glucosaminide N-acetyltransferase domain-containing protein [Parafilimonas sp.]